ncbi:hypothetical protein [Wolbachia endosymbiont (group A) of Agelastica alni]
MSGCHPNTFPCHPSSLLLLSSQCLDYLDPENLTLMNVSSRLHNKD